MAAVYFCLGAIIASFMGVVAARLNTGHSIAKGRSRCDACDTPLSMLALVPVVSHFARGGRAQCCGAKLSLVSPLSEVLLGLLFVLAYIKLGLTWALVLVLIELALLLALVLYDLAHQILPPVLLYPFVALSLIQSYLVSAGPDSFIFNFEVALGVGAFFLALHYLSRGRAMGFADAPLAFGLSLMVGAEHALTGLAFSFWVGAAVGVIILLRRPAGSRMGIEVPFAPFLAIGFLLSYFFIAWNPFLLLIVA